MFRPAQFSFRKLSVCLLLAPLFGVSVQTALAEDFNSRRWIPELRFATHYHDHCAYINAVANKIRAHWAAHGRAEKLIFSYHGVPQSYLDKGDPYHCECYKTTRLVAEALELEEAEYATTFQSRFGRQQWLKPYTDKVLQELATDGVKSVQILCPGFSADCLETIEEIDEENRRYFLDAGGERFEYIPCLNSDAEHISALAQLIDEQLAGWTSDEYANENSKALALARGAVN